MDVALIGAAYNGLKFVKESLQVALGYQIDNESQDRINAALKEVGTAQDTLFNLREELIRLQTENDQLRQELKNKDDWENQESQYQLVNTSGRATVYESIGGEPKHYACPNCYSKKIIQPLQKDRDSSGVFTCPGCKAEYPVEPSQKKKATFNTL